MFDRLLRYLGLRSDEKRTDPVDLLYGRASRLAASLLSVSRNRARLRTFAISVLTALVVLAVVLLDIFDQSELAGHIVDLAKFVIPTLFASDAVIRYGESRLVCCVLDREPEARPEGSSRP